MAEPAKKESHLPKPDPDNANARRAFWGADALSSYAYRTQCDPEDVLSDLLTDLMHYCDRRDLDFAHELQRAQNNYQGETTP